MDITENNTKKIYLPFQYREHQKHILEKLGRFNIVVCHRRFGKQQDITLPVPMANGTFKLLGDIVDGDMILDNFGKPTKVLQAHPINHTPEAYDVVLDNGDKVKSCKDHQWYVEPSYSKVGKRSDRATWKPGKVVSTGELKEMIKEESWFIPCTEPVQFKKSKVTIEPYLLGLWLGDGSSDDFRVCGIDKEIHNYVLAFSTTKSPQYTNSSGVSYTRAGSVRIIKDTNLYKNKHIPANYKNGSIEQRIELIQGLMDTDGTQTPTGSKFFNKNKVLIEDMKEVLQSLGIKVSLKTYRGDEHTLMFSSWFNPFKLERKRKLWKVRGNRASKYKVVAVEPVESVPMRCLSVDSPMNMFLITKNYIPTHNTVMMIMHLFLSSMIIKKKNPVLWYMCPQLDQAVTNGWQYLKDFASYIPGVKIYETENKITYNLNDGYGIRTIALKGAVGSGSNLRGAYLDGLVMDEMGSMPSGVWEDIVRPMLADRLGWAVLTGTPMTGYFHQFYKTQTQLNEEGEGEFKIFNYTVYDTKVIDDDEINSLKKTMDKGKFAREFLNEWIAPDIGSYYSKHLFAMQEIGHVADSVARYDPGKAVITSWDLGRNDYTAVWFWQLGEDNTFNIIDFLQARGKLDTDILREVLAKRYNMSTMLLPHDSVHKHISAENSTYMKFRKMLPQVQVRVVPKATPQAGIDATLSMIRSFRINSTKCAIGLEALHAYKSEMKEKHGVLSTAPVHDWSSHAADALRTFTMGWQGIRFSQGLSSTERKPLTPTTSYDPI